MSLASKNGKLPRTICMHATSMMPSGRCLGSYAFLSHPQCWWCWETGVELLKHHACMHAELGIMHVSYTTQQALVQC
jgi:hypothetical protein